MKENQNLPIESRIGELSALLTYICEGELPVYHGFHRAWGLLQACIELEGITYDLMEKIYQSIVGAPLLVFSDIPEYQLQQNAITLALDILADLPISFQLAPEPKRQNLHAEIEAILWFVDEKLLIPNAGFLYRTAYRLVRAGDETALNLFASRYEKYVDMARDSRLAVS